MNYDYLKKNMDKFFNNVTVDELIGMLNLARSENRHYTKVWKERRKNKHADKCGDAKCFVCHSDKIGKVPTRQLMQANSKQIYSVCVTK